MIHINGIMLPIKIGKSDDNLGVTSKTMHLIYLIRQRDLKVLLNYTNNIIKFETHSSTLITNMLIKLN